MSSLARLDIRLNGVYRRVARPLLGTLLFVAPYADAQSTTPADIPASVELLRLRADTTSLPSSDGAMVYDTANGVNWLADANLAATNRFGLPLCNGSINTRTCVNLSGSMTYQAAAAWVAAMNAANYLGHNNWQLPTTPIMDDNCGFIGPQSNSFGYNCSASALGSLYYSALGLKTPNSAVPIPNNTAGPFSNFQPYIYWSQTSGTEPTGNSGCCGTFSFNSGWQGSNVTSNYLYVLPMKSPERRR